MSPGMLKMWISISSMVLLAIAVFSLYLGRYKIKNKILKVFFMTIAYSFLILAGFIVLFIVFSGPTND